MSGATLTLTDFEGLREPIAALYGPKAVPAQESRYQHLLAGLEESFGPWEKAAVFSAPGRTEIGGNHTDHQHGRVLAASINLDAIAAVSLNGENVIRVQSEGYPPVVVELDSLDVRESERNTSAAIIRGIASWFRRQGADLAGFSAYVMSSVLGGSGLSSSAAFEILFGKIMNDLFFDGRCSAIQLAQVGQYAENVYFGKPSGLLDQMGCSVGGMVTIDFQDNANPVVERVDFDFAATGYALCIIDSGADHADLTGEYAAVPGELKEICAHFGKSVLREVPEEEFLAALPVLRRKAGDRAVLRAMHIYDDNRHVAAQVEALRRGDFDAFLKLITASGLSSWRQLQNVVPAGYTHHQEVAVALSLCERSLGGRGACRVHGGGFAGTIQAFVPLDMLDTFKVEMERYLGDGACHVLTIRPVGGVRLA